MQKWVCKQLRDNKEVRKVVDCILELFWQLKPKQRDNKLILLKSCAKCTNSSSTARDWTGRALLKLPRIASSSVRGVDLFRTLLYGLGNAASSA